MCILCAYEGETLNAGGKIVIIIIICYAASVSVNVWVLFLDA
jgi:hypothetical protein